MGQQVITFPFSGGVNRAEIPLRSNLGDFYTMQQLRHSRIQHGAIEQIPYLTATAMTRRNYWNGSNSVTEPAGSKILMIAGSYRMTQYTFSYAPITDAQLQVFYQIVWPTAETIFTGCRLVINDVTALAITLGSGVEVEMTGTAAFRWRKNGGAWTAEVPAITGVSIDSGNATLYFLATTGFAGTEAWAWQRTDASFGPSGYVTTNAGRFVFYKDTLYFLSVDGRVMIANTTHAITVGYRPVFGTCLTFYNDHMIVGGYSTTIQYSYTQPRAITIGWSDKTDIHCFIPTDVNEADLYTLPNISSFGGIPSSIKGVSVQKQQLFIVTEDEIYTTPYYGLPVVFSFIKYADVGAIRATLVFEIPNFLLIVGSYGITTFDGANLTSIGKPINAFTPGILYGGYNRAVNEVLFGNASKAYIFQLDYGTWYTRSLDTGYTTACATFDQTTWQFGTSGLVVLAENSYTTAPQRDASTGTAFSPPTLCTQLFGGKLHGVQEITGLFLGASVATVDTTYYSTAANVQVKLYWYPSVTGLIDTSGTTDVEAVWVNTNVDGWIPLPRVNFRSLALEIQVVGLVTNKPPGKITLTALEPKIYTTTTVEK